MKDKKTLVPNNSQSVVQNYEVNWGSRSCSTTCGTPKLCTTWLKNKCTTDDVESSPSPTTIGISLTHLVSLSTTVNTPLNDLLSGRSVMKSIDHTQKHSAGLSIGYNKPAWAEVKSWLANLAPMHKCRDLMQQAWPPNMVKQRRQSLADT